MIYDLDSFLGKFLLPCPFCASKEMGAAGADEWWAIECAVCNAMGPATNDTVYALEDPIKATGDTEISDEEESSINSGPVAAALLWNIRNGPGGPFEERGKEILEFKPSEEKPNPQEVPCPFCSYQGIDQEESADALLGHHCRRCGAYGPSQWDFKKLESPVTPEALWKLWRTRLTVRPTPQVT